MRLITVSREYGAGGGELASRLAAALGWQLLDHEFLHRAAQLERLPDSELEAVDEQAVRLADRFRRHPRHERYIHGLSEAARQAALEGNVVLVGRGSRHLAGDAPGAFHLRLVAPRDWRVRRMAALENLSIEKAVARCAAVDRTRGQFTRYFFGPAASQPCQYDLVANTARMPMDEITGLVVSLVRSGLAAHRPAQAPRARVLTVARELGAGETGFAPTLADRLGLRCYDRALLEQEAVRLGVLEIDAEKFDESPAGVFDRLRPAGIHHRYFEILRQLITELAARGEVLLVGRGSSCFLRDCARAFHVRLVASMATRLRRVMEYRWLAEAPARKLIADSDDRRVRFYRDYFQADWSSPLEYDLTVNTGRIGPIAVDLVAQAANQCWDRSDRV